MLTIPALGVVVLWTIAIGLALPPVSLTRLTRTTGTLQIPRGLRGRPDGYPLRTRALAATTVGVVAVFVLDLPPLAMPPVAVVIAVAVTLLLGTVESPASKSRTASLTTSLPATCDLLAACLDAGLPLRTAATVVSEAIGGPMAEELARVTTQTALGISDEEAWRSLTTPVLRRLGRDLSRAAHTGIVSSHTLRAHATDATAQARAIREETARKAGVKSVTPLMVCFLPAFMLIGIVPIVGGLVGHFLG